MIDIDKFICDFLSAAFEEKDQKDIISKCDYRNANTPLYIVRKAVKNALKAQGLEYKDGEIQSIEKPTTIKFEDDNPQTLDEISKNGYIDMGRPIELTIPKEKKRYFSDIYDDKDEFRNKVEELIHSGESAYLNDSFWGKEEVEKLMKETDEGSKKIMEQMRKIVFAKDPDIDTMVEKFAESKGGIFGAERDAYRKGLEDMYRHLKGE